jgi:hypothetical protein
MLRKIHGPAASELGPDRILAISTVRNELSRLPYFLDYYRALGIDHFVFIDNASDDGTTDFLRGLNDATVVWTDESYKESRAGVLWMNAVLDEYGSGHWCLTADSDELFAYHGVELVDLKLLCRYLDSRGAEAVFSFMLDCYGPLPPSQQHYQPGQPFLQACPYFDGDGYHTHASDRFPYFAIFGGMRRRVFRNKGEDGWGPALRKVPLVKWRAGLAYVYSTHAMTPCRLADITGVILHFKFLGDFGALAQAEVKRGDRYMANDYQRYAQILSDFRGSFLYPNSVPFVDTCQMVRCKMLRTTKEWLDYLTAAIGAIEEQAAAQQMTAPLLDSLRFRDVHHARPLDDSLHFIDMVTHTLRELGR